MSSACLWMAHTGATYPDAELYVHLALSRDGTRLAFSRGGTDAEIQRLDLQQPERSAPIASSSMFEIRRPTLLTAAGLLSRPIARVRARSGCRTRTARTLSR